MENDNSKLKNRRQKIWEAVKKNVGVLTLLSTSIMAIATGYLAYETKNLAEIDLRPYISPKDVMLEFVDNSNTPKRRITQLGIEDFNNTTINNDDLSRITLTLKFKNPSKLEGYINAESISTLSGKTYGWSDSNFLIPGMSDSGWLLGIDVKEHLEADSFVYYDYVLSNYSSELDFDRTVKFSVKCDFRNISKKQNERITDTNCMLEEYKNHYK